MRVWDVDFQRACHYKQVPAASKWAVKTKTTKLLHELPPGNALRHAEQDDRGL